MHNVAGGLGSVLSVWDWGLRFLGSWCALLASVVSFYASGMGECGVFLLFCSIAGRAGGSVGGCLGIWVGGWMGLWVCMDSMGLCGWGWPCGYVPLNCMGLVVLATRIYHVYK